MQVLSIYKGSWASDGERRRQEIDAEGLASTEIENIDYEEVIMSQFGELRKENLSRSKIQLIR
jgi:hypothetical protein